MKLVQKETSLFPAIWHVSWVLLSAGALLAVWDPSWVGYLSKTIFLLSSPCNEWLLVALSIDVKRVT